MRYAKRKKFLSGFTLIEVLVSLAVFSILFAVFVPVIDSSIRMNRKSVDMLSSAIEASSGKHAIEMAEKVFDGTVSIEDMPGGIKYVNVTSTVTIDGVSTPVEVNWLTDPNDGGAELPVFLMQKVNGVIFYFYIPYHPFRCGSVEKCPTCAIPIGLPGAGGDNPDEGDGGLDEKK